MEEKKICYIVTEGQFDIEILKRVLPNEIMRNFNFVASMGYSSALSKAKSLALRLKNKIILILDSDTKSKIESEYKKEQIEFVFKSLGKQNQVQVFLFQPEIEMIFFESENLKASLTNRNLILPETHTLQVRKSLVDKRSFIGRLTEHDVELIRTETSMKEVIKLCTTMCHA